jgi:plasmid stabilization system protein ParE
MPRCVIYSEEATDDIHLIIKHSTRKFGVRVAQSYMGLIDQAVLDLSTNPERVGVLARFQLLEGMYFYHLKHSKRQVKGTQRRINTPRHFVAFRLVGVNMIQIVRVLHDRMKFEIQIFDINSWT